MNARDMNNPDSTICPLMSQHFTGQGFISCQRERCAWWVANKECCAIARPK